MRNSFRIVTLLGFLVLAASPGAEAVAQTDPAQVARIVTPEFFADNPFIIPSYSIVKIARLKSEGETRVTMESSDRISRTRQGDLMAYSRYQTRTRPDGSVSIDTVRFRVADLAPLSRTSVSGSDTLRLEFSVDGVTGERRTESGVENISASFDKPFFDSKILDYLSLLLAQNQPASYMTPLYVDGNNRIEWYSIVVNPVVTVNFSGEPEKAIKVTYKNPEGKVGVIWVKDGFVQVLREETYPTPGVEIVADWQYQ